jgi:hypothetical protein
MTGSESRNEIPNRSRIEMATMRGIEVLIQPVGFHPELSRIGA